MAHKLNLAIKDLLGKTKVTQKSIAEVLNISQPSLNRRFQSNKIAFSQNEIEQILKLANISQSEFEKTINSYSINDQEEAQLEQISPTSHHSSLDLLKLKIKEMEIIQRNLERERAEDKKEIHEKSIIIADLRRDKQMLIEDKERLLAQINEGNQRKASNGQ